MPEAKFKLGQVVATPGALQALEDAGQSPDHFLDLHQNGSWGELDESDRRLNDRAVAQEGDPDHQGRVFSRYLTCKGAKLYVITEWDRSVTTLLLPEDY